jgi:hypothetical protein
MHSEEGLCFCSFAPKNQQIEHSMRKPPKFAEVSLKEILAQSVILTSSMGPPPPPQL